MGGRSGRLHREGAHQPGERGAVRACAVHAVELLVKEIQAAGQAATSASLDILLYNAASRRAISVLI